MQSSNPAVAFTLIQEPLIKLYQQIANFNFKCLDDEEKSKFITAVRNFTLHALEDIDYQQKQNSSPYEIANSYSMTLVKAVSTLLEDLEKLPKDYEGFFLPAKLAILDKYKDAIGSQFTANATALAGSAAEIFAYGFGTFGYGALGALAGFGASFWMPLLAPISTYGGFCAGSWVGLHIMDFVVNEIKEIMQYCDNTLPSVHLFFKRNEVTKDAQQVYDHALSLRR